MHLRYVLIGFAFALVLSGNAAATPVTFSTTGTFGDTGSDTLIIGDYTLYFKGVDPDTYNPDPIEDVIFGTFTAIKYGRGKTDFPDIPFYLNITQTESEDKSLSGQFTGIISANGGHVKLKFSELTETIASDPPVLYELSHKNYTIPVYNGSGWKSSLLITGTVDPPPPLPPSSVPEPASLVLLGTGLGAIGLAAWRRKKESV